MKKRNLFAVVAMFSIFLFGIGAAYAITGVDDAVPGQDIVIPIICEGFQPNDPGGNPVGEPVFGTMNTVWAIAETTMSACVLDASVCTPKDMAGVLKTTVPGVAKASVYVYDRLSERKLDLTECWSRRDVISNQCKDMILGMPPADRDAMEVTINNVKYFVGYVEYRQSTACNPAFPVDQIPSGSAYVENTLVAWVYLNDAPKGFLTGFNGFSIENGIGPNGLTETCLDGSCSGNDIGITARSIFPRYYILNSDMDSYTWWILLLGRNDYQQEYLLGLVPENNIRRELTCYFCDENENCQSNEIPLPHELNIINVAGFIPGSVWPSGWPIADPAGKRGFAYCTIDESGAFTGQLANTVINGTLSFDGVDGAANSLAETYSLFGLSYQRAFPTGGDVNQKLAVVHPIHRLYCGDIPLVAPFTGDASELPDRFDDAGNNTVAQCSITGPVLLPVAP